MPTYDYTCTLCNHEMEAFHAMSAEPLKDCPACGQPGLKRRIGTGAGLLFKGSGFYTTDYRSDNYKKAAKADSGATKPPASPATKDKPAATKPAASAAAG